MRIGVHVSIAGGLPKAIERAKIRGCDTIQIFARTPRAWKAKPWDPEEVAKFKSSRRESGISPVFIHTCYLLNLAGPNAELRRKSIDALVDDLRRAEMGGVEYVVTHPGSSPDLDGGLRRVREACLEAVDLAGGRSRILIENVSGGGGKVGASFEELAEIVGGTEFGICLDTCHAFAAGYVLDEEPAKVLDQLDEVIGLRKLEALHLNDSFGARGSHVDHHQHIGKGEIGMQGFRRILGEPRMRAVPGVLETPQRAGDDPTDDLINLSALRSILDEFR